MGVESTLALCRAPGLLVTKLYRWESLQGVAEIYISLLLRLTS